MCFLHITMYFSGLNLPNYFTLHKDMAKAYNMFNKL